MVRSRHASRRPTEPTSLGARERFLPTPSVLLALTREALAGVAPPADDTEEPTGVDPNAPEKWTELGLQNVGR
jgi:hypothetical protein